MEGEEWTMKREVRNVFVAVMVDERRGEAGIASPQASPPIHKLTTWGMH